MVKQTRTIPQEKPQQQVKTLFALENQADVEMLNEIAESLQDSWSPSNRRRGRRIAGVLSKLKPLQIGISPPAK